MFPLQRGNELVIQFSKSPHQQQQQHQQDQEISEDLILVDDCASLDVANNNDSHHKIFTKSTADEDNSNSSIDLKKKKMVHRDIERQRRQEMASLYSSLRSLLPLDSIKGKRSISEHMNEAVTYIKQKQKHIKELGDKRDQLKKLSNCYSINLEKNNHENNKPNTSCFSFTVQEINNSNNGVVGIEIDSGIISDEGVIVSKLMQLLLDEGLDVVSYLSTKVNGRLLHSVKCQVNNSSNTVDLCELRRKLANLIPS